MRSRLPSWSAVAVVLSAIMLQPRPVAAQTDVEELGRARGARPPPGYYELLRTQPNAFQFSPENGWIKRGQQVAAQRGAMRAAGTGGALPAPQARFNPNGVLTGLLNVPVFLILFSNTDSAGIVGFAPRTTMADRLYGTQVAPPYSVHTYYREISNDSLVVNGQVFDWTRIAVADSTAESNCNGLCAQAHSGMATMIREIVRTHDGVVDYGQFDNDGPDGIPNSGDDDGYIDAIVLVHPEVDGFCKARNAAAETSIWAHKWTYQARAGGSDFPTNDDIAGGVGKIKIRDYIIQGGQGGDGGCSSNQPLAFGIVAHETGHLFGLPDLYDIRNNSAGIGKWGLMGYGHQQQYFRPAHMTAWSRAELGWITEVIIGSDTTVDISPIATSDTAFVLPIAGSNEFFLMANRQRIGSDSLIIEPGLLIWHVDSVLMRLRRPLNTVNASLPHALALEQADGSNGLSTPQNLGDPGDPYPGSSVSTEFGFSTTPSSVRNSGAPTYIVVDQIAQLAPFGPMRARITFAKPSLIAASDTLAKFRLDMVTYNRFVDVLTPGSHTLDMDAVQVTGDSSRQFTWLSWSNLQPRSHTFTATSGGDTIVADVATAFLVKVTTAGLGGTVSSTPVLDLAAGAFAAQGSAVTLVASVTQPGHIFEGWSGDTTWAGETLNLVMTRPFRLRALFASPLAVPADPLPVAVMGAPYQQALVATGGTGTYAWTVTTGTLPQGIALARNGLLVGRPIETGSFTFGVQVTSGSQAASQTFQLEVKAPALVTGDLVEHLIGPTEPLSADAIAFLDLIGNKNGRFDVGDFLAWLLTTGALASAADLSRVMR